MSLSSFELGSLGRGNLSSGARNRVLTWSCSKGKSRKSPSRGARGLPCLSPSHVPSEEGKEAGKEEVALEGTGQELLRATTL